MNDYNNAQINSSNLKRASDNHGKTMQLTIPNVDGQAQQI